MYGVVCSAAASAVMSDLLFTLEFQRQIEEAQKLKPWPWPKSKPEEQHFDTEAHRAFMRSLG